MSIVGGMMALSGMLVAFTIREMLARRVTIPPEDGLILRKVLSKRKREEGVNVLGE
jgi:hypothetical protein